jgi:preprotein translocase subunit SecD
VTRARSALDAALVLVAVACTSDGGSGAPTTTGNSPPSSTTTTASKPPVHEVDGAEAVLVVPGADDAALQAIAGTMRRRLAVFGEGDVLLAVVSGQLIVDLPIKDTAATALDVAMAPGLLSIHTVLQVLPSCPVPSAEVAPAAVPFHDERDGCAVVGPDLNTGPAVTGAPVTGTEEQPTVDLQLTLSGIDALQRGSAACSARTADCPSGRLAFVLDGEVIAAPSPLTATFSTPSFHLSGPFDATEAAALSGTLAAGPLASPVSVAAPLAEVRRNVIGATPAAAPTVVVLAQLGTRDGGPSSRVEAVSDVLRDELGELGIDGASVSGSDDQGTLTVVATGSTLVPEALKEAVRAALELDDPFRLLVAQGAVA